MNEILITTELNKLLSYSALPQFKDPFPMGLVALIIGGVIGLGVLFKKGGKVSPIPSATIESIV